MEHLLDQPEAGEADEGGEVFCLALIVEFFGDRVQLDPIDAADRHDGAVHRQHHALHGGHALIGGVQPQHVELAGLGERHRAVAQQVGAGTQVDRGALQRQQFTRVPNATAGDHCGHVGHTKKLCRLTVRTGVARLANPHTDGDFRIGDALQQLSHVSRADHRTASVELQDQRLRTVLLAAGDGVLDGLHRHGVEQARDLEHIDGRQIGSARLTGGRSRRIWWHRGTNRAASRGCAPKKR